MGKVFRFVLVSSIAMLLGGAATALPAAGDADRDRQVFVDAMAPHGAARPVVAVLALNEGTEMTDLLLPTAVLRRADVADVVVVAPRAGEVALYPALRVRGRSRSRTSRGGTRPGPAMWSCPRWSTTTIRP